MNLRDGREQLQEDRRRWRSKPATTDNLDGTRQDPQSNFYHPVFESFSKVPGRSRAQAVSLGKQAFQRMKKAVDPFLFYLSKSQALILAVYY